MVYGSKTMNRSYRNGGLFCYIGCARGIYESEKATNRPEGMGIVALFYR